MPRYYFSLEDGRSKLSDEFGEELVDDDAARLAALEVAGDLARNRNKLGNLRVVVRTADDRIVSEAPLKDAPL
jgi:hypothetical protein